MTNKSSNMQCSVKINGGRSPYRIISVVVQQTCLGLSSAELTLQPDSQDPLTTEEVENLLGADVEVSWSAGQETQRFIGKVDRLAPSLSSRQQYLSLSVITLGEGMQTSPWLRVFTGRPLSEIVEKIASDNDRIINFSGHDPVVYFSIQQYEDDVSYLQRLAEHAGKVFYHDGLTMYFKDWTATDNTFDLPANRITSISADFNLTPCRLNLKGRIRGARNSASLATELGEISVEPLATIQQRSAVVYDEARMALQPMLDPENRSGHYARLMRRQVRQMVAVDVASDLMELSAGVAVSFSSAVIVPDGQRYRIGMIRHEFRNNGEYTNNFRCYPDEALACPSPDRVALPTIRALRARVVSTKDDQSLGRATVTFPEADHADDSPWLSVLTPYTGAGGCFAFAEPGDEVQVWSINGKMEEDPVIMGAFYTVNIKSDNWQNGQGVRKGFQFGSIGIFADRDTGRLTFCADEVSFKVRGQMELEVREDLIQKARIIHLNP